MTVYSRHPWLALEVLLAIAVLLPLFAPLVGLNVGPALTSAFLFGPVLGILVAVDGLVSLRAWIRGGSNRRPITGRRIIGVGVRVLEFVVSMVYLLVLLAFYLSVRSVEPGQGTGAGLSLFIVGLVGGVALALLVMGRAIARWFLMDRADASPPQL